MTTTTPARLLAEASDPATPPERLSQLANDAAMPAEVVEAATRNPSLPSDTHAELLAAGDIDAWMNPQTPFTLLTHGAPHRGAARAVQSIARLGVAERLAELGSTMRPVLEAWWAEEDNGEVMARYISDLAVWERGKPEPRLYRLATRMALLPVWEALDDMGPWKGRLRPLVEELEAWVDSAAKEPIKPLRSRVRAKMNEIQQAATETESWYASTSENVAKALDAAAYGNAEQAFQNAMYAFLEGHTEDRTEEEDAFRQRMADEYRELASACPLPDGWGTA